MTDESSNHAVDIAHEHLAAVRRVVAAQDEIRSALVETANYRYTHRAFAEALDRLRVTMADDRRRSPAERGGAHRVLTQDELGILHVQMERYQRAHRLMVLDRQDTHAAWGALNILRANHLAKGDDISGEKFRSVTRLIARRWIHQFRWDAPVPDSWRPFAVVTKETLVALPWRAALVPGEALLAYGIRNFLHLGIRRNEITADPDVYAEERAGGGTQQSSGVVVEPMCATGQSAGVAVESVLAHITEPNVVLFSYIAAPEGVDYLLRTYHDLRIVTVALDTSLNARAYIEPGLGDFGDLVMRGVDEAYAREHWINTEFLTLPQVDRIFARTREVAAAHAAIASPASRSS